MLEDERALVDGKRAATRLGFALLLKFYTRHGRSPAGDAELPGAVADSTCVLHFWTALSQRICRSGVESRRPRYKTMPRMPQGKARLC